MKKQIFLLVVLVVLAVSVNAQSKNEKTFKIGVGAMVGLPMGDIADAASLAYGFDVIGEYAVAPKIGLTISAGYLDWAKKSGFGGNWSSIPVLVGGKYYFSDKLYGSAQVGFSFYSESIYGTAFTFAPGIGYKISEKFDLLLKYQSAGKDGWADSSLGLRAGFSF